MQNIIKNICKVISIILLLIIIIYLLPDDIDELFYIKAITHSTITEIRDIIIVQVNENKNTSALNKYLKIKFGDAIFNTIEINKKYRYGSEMCYILKMPFVDKYSVGVENGIIVSDNFYEILSTDPKFQHLYSEWVKKQVGIEDSDVELKIAFSKDSIDFKSIVSLSDDCHEIFKSIKESSFQTIYVKNVKGLDYKNYESLFYEIKDRYSLGGRINSKNFIMSIYNFDTKLYDNDNYYGEPYIKSPNDLECVVHYWNDRIESAMFFGRINGNWEILKEIDNNNIN